MFVGDVRLWQKVGFIMIMEQYQKKIVFQLFYPENQGRNISEIYLPLTGTLKLQ